MSEKRQKVINLRTSGTTNINNEISPKLPTPDYVVHGEVCVSYATDYEALSFKNVDDEIVDFRPNKFYEKKFDEINNTIVDSEHVTSAALNDLNTRIDKTDDNLTNESKRAQEAESALEERISEIEDNVDGIVHPDEVVIGTSMTGEPDIWIDTSDNSTVAIYTQSEVDTKDNAVLEHAKTYTDEQSLNVVIGSESESDKGMILIDTSEDPEIEVYTKAQVNALLDQIRTRLDALEA